VRSSLVIDAWAGLRLRRKTRDDTWSRFVATGLPSCSCRLPPG
jgi:hypothetical protein